MKEPAYIEQGAGFDDERIYRYTLLRRWSPGPMCLWIMLNPSTADSVKLDPTLQRCLGFTLSWTTGAPWVRGDDFDVHARARGEIEVSDGFGAMEVCNIYAFRSPHPEDLWATKDPVGPGNDAAIQVAAKRATLVIVGWGNNAKPDRERQVAQLLADIGVQPHTLQICKNGSPGHPLARGKMRIPDSATPIPWHAKGLR